MLRKSCTQYASKFEKLSNGHRTGKGQFSFQSQKRAMLKNVQTTAKIALISHASKVMLIILQSRLQLYMNQELPDVQAGFWKGRGTRHQFANIHWIIEKAGEFQKKKKKPIYFCFIDYAKAFVWITTNCGKFLKRWKYQTTLPVSWETCMQIKKQQLEPGIEQWTGSKLGKGYIKAVYCHLLIQFLYRVYHTKCLAGWNWNQDFLEKYQQSQICYSNDTTLMAEREEELKSLLMKIKEESEKASLSLNIQKTNIMEYGPIFIANTRGKMETVADFIFLGSEVTGYGDCSREIKTYLLLGRKAMTNLDSVLKSRDITLLRKVCLVKVVVFPVVMYGCESWTIKKAECC